MKNNLLAISRPVLRAAIYARVSSEQQTKAATIDSQVQALTERVCQDGLALEEELRFLDEGYSGATLIRPALEKLRDVAHAGGVDRLYVHSPDRLARKYAYQVLLIEEFQRNGVEVVFLNHAPSKTPEEDLLLQMQGMIAEYERAKILERSRRGKRHAARRGDVSVLSGAPYGYRYISKRVSGGAAQYQVVLEEARVVRQVFDWTARDGLSLREICRRLKEQQVPTRGGKDWWDPTTVAGMLKNAAYTGSATFGKTRIGPRRPALRPGRGQSEQPRRAYSVYATDPSEQEAIAVPRLVSDEVFQAAAERLEENRRRGRERRRGAKYLLQGLLQCQCCGYSYYGKPVSPRAAKGQQRRYAYYRCIGSDAYRFGGRRVCHNGQVRTDVLEQAVWDDVVSLLKNPQRVAQEYERRLRGNEETAAGVQELRGLIQKQQRALARLIDAYEDGLLTKEEFGPRVTESKKRLAMLEAEAAGLSAQQTEEQELRLAIEHLNDFTKHLEQGLDHVDWNAKRDVLRALVKRVEIGGEAVRVVYRVSPPPFAKGLVSGASLQHCLRSDHAALGRPLLGAKSFRMAVGVRLHDDRFQPHPNQAQHRAIHDSHSHRRQQLVVRDRVEVPFQIRIINFPQSGVQMLTDGVDGLVGVLAWTKPIGAVQEVRLKDRLQDQQHRCLHDAVFDRRNPQRPLPTVGLGNVNTLHRRWPIALREKFFMQLLEERCRARPINDVLTRYTVRSSSAVVLHHQPPGGRQNVEPTDSVIQGVEPKRRLLLGLSAQFPPQFRDFHGQLHARLDLRLGRRLVWVRRPVFRSGLIQAALLTSCRNNFLAGFLRSAAVTRFRRYYEPIRLPTRPTGGYLFPTVVGYEAPRVAAISPGLPGSWLIFRRPPSALTPGNIGRRTRSLLGGRHRASPFLGGWPFPCRINEAETGSLSLRLTSSPFQAPAERLPYSTAGSATCRTSNFTWSAPFS